MGLLKREWYVTMPCNITPGDLFTFTLGPNKWHLWFPLAVQGRMQSPVGVCVLLKTDLLQINQTWFNLRLFRVNSSV